jgi:hypothetical protein
MIFESRMPSRQTHLPREISKRALSIRQPLSELILLGEKTLEFRSRLTHIRERVYLYAGKKLTIVDDVLAKILADKIG